MINVTEWSLRRQFLSIYLLILMLTGCGSALALYSNYVHYQQGIFTKLQQEAQIANVEVEGILIDATKLLDVAVPQITKRINAGTLTTESAHQILQSTRDIFQSFIADKALLSTLYIDENGIARASTANVVQSQIHLSDRLYFQDLKNNPQLTYAIGNLVTARTTGLLTFHIAKPIVDQRGTFRGVVAQQVSATDLGDILERSRNGIAPAQITLHRHDGAAAFIYPRPTDLSQVNTERALWIGNQVIAQSKKVGVMPVTGNTALEQDAYIGYVKSQRYDVITSVTMPKLALLTSFLNINGGLLSYCLLAFIVLSLVMWRFGINTIKLSSATLMSQTDTLTKLSNRRAFDLQFAELWKLSRRAQKPISLLFMDIDHFKKFNDQYGHECGDLALVAITRAIAQCLNRPIDDCFRWGGEEFVVLLPDTHEQGAITLANKILEAVRAIELSFPSEKSAKMTISIGIASAIASEQNSTQSLLDDADQALYVAKQSGRDRFALADSAHPPHHQGIKSSAGLLRAQ